MPNFKLDTLDWTAVSAITTLLMTLATFTTVIFSRKQIKEIRRQWIEDNKARLEFSIVNIGKSFFLKIENVGKRMAYNVNIKINDNFLNKMLIERNKEMLVNISNKIIHLQPNRVFYFPISPCKDFNGTIVSGGKKYTKETINPNIDILMYEPIEITGKYCDSEIINEKFTIDEFIGSIIINSPELIELKNIVDELNNINDTLEKVQK